MEKKIFGGPDVPEAERILRAIDRLVSSLCKKETKQNGAEQVLAIRQAGHAAGFAIASIVWAHQGSVARAREIERRTLLAFHALIGGMSVREKQYAVLQTVEIAAEHNMLATRTPAATLAFFRDRVKDILPKALLLAVTFEHLEPAIVAAGRKPGRRRGTKTGQKSKSKSDVLNELLKRLEIGAAGAAALEKARQKKPVIPRLPE